MYYYIVDPQKISQREFERVQNELYSSLSLYHIAGEVVRVTGVRTINQLVENAFAMEVKTLVAVGSDETLHDVINAVGSREMVIGFIPLIKTELGKILGIKDITQAIKTLASRRIAELDLGMVNTGNYFLGKISFGLENNFQPIEIKFSANNEYQASLIVAGGLIINSRYDFSDDSKITDPSDAVLDLLLLPKLSRWQTFWHRNQISSGNFEKIPQASMLHVKKLEITSPVGLALKLEGRVLARTPATVDVLPQALKIIVSKERTFWKGLLPVLFIVALLLAFSDTTHPSQVHAAAAFVQDTSAGVASGTTLTTSSVTVTGGNLLVLGILHNSGITPTISDSRGNTYQLDRQGATFDGTRTVAVYSAIANSSGSLTATVSVTTAQRLGLILTEFSGMDTSASRVDQSNTAAGAGLTASSGNITTTVSNVLLYGLAGHQSNTAATLGVGYSNLEAPGGEGRRSSESKVVSGTVTDDADFGLGTSRNFSAIVVAYKPSGGGGTPPPPPPPATTFFTEGFENTSFSSRGWYDATNHPITTSQPHSGTAAAQYHWAVGDTQPSGLAGMRHLFTASDSTYVSYWVKYSSNFIGG